ncbi:hypothetical protein [Rhizobium sp. LC145]|uniref:hypothetical protein n=1 Tax=Rhizobium sp. LC145 TaxID=1120688 RepID=UPI00062A48A5|nr:hypothetical protein [Rhizobium sp. LC145]KKX33856.1 hypothetical protein YH62_01370 [Rhizobium sp. LC145]TKT60034.1 hypothetical protein FDR95_08025 [Rhizobiaceae bacterium LC148]
MADLIKELVTGVVENVMRELLKKSHGRTTTKRKKRKAQAAGGRPSRAKTEKTKTVVCKQVSRRRSAASRSRQRAR